MERKGRIRGITEHLEIVDDPRTGQNSRHRLIDIIVLAVLGVTAGSDTWEEIAEYAEDHQEWLRKFLELPSGIPSHDTIRRVFIRLDPQQLEQAFRNWADGLRDTYERQVIAIDGKTIRRSHDSFHGKSAVHVVSAWASDFSLVLGQVATKEKSNEITAIPELLESLHLKGSVVSIDAMGCQTSIAETICRKQADYVLAVKDNQKNIHDQLKWFFGEIELPTDEATGLVKHTSTFDKEHGRMERRDYLVSGELDWMSAELKGFPQVKSIGMVQCRRTVHGKTSVERRYYISSLEPNAGLFAKAVRSHWGIENKVHWVLDMVFREDESRIRKGHSARNMATIRRIAMNLIRRDPNPKKRTLKLRRKKASYNNTYLASLLFANDPPQST